MGEDGFEIEPELNVANEIVADFVVEQDRVRDASGAAEAVAPT